ncbi:multidrug efflux system membrane fusion protein [Edaphobacter aggregans]|uniref:Multidrug efflux system membrane fusion protein n=2 Tax=Edaphobacter aggregans TaxID=570835 RepID=A0A3R9QIN0_9BACT|nr:multidrug efflux system membrane fusion protein [Edaphobacter aggregans]
MSSAQISEQETNAALPAPKPQISLPEPEKPKGSGFRKWIVVLVIALAVGAAVWKIRKNSQEQVTQGQKMAAMLDRPTPVQVVAVQQKTMPIYLTELGTVTAYNTVTIKSRVDGQLIRVNVTEGQTVHQGQLLAEIDPAPYQAALAQAEGQLVKDQAAAANATAEAARYTALLDAGVVSKENQQAQVSTAGQMEGSIDADKAAIQAAKVNLAYTKITSPINGVVGLRQVDPGNIVHAADTTGLLVVTQLQPIAVIFTLPEDHLQDVLKLTRNGHTLAVEAYDRSGTTHLASGKVLTVDNQIDTTTGTVKVKAVFDNKDGALFPNQFVNVRLILEQRANSLVIPAAALQSGTQGSFVYLVHPGDPPANLLTNGSDSGTQGRRRRAAGATNAGAPAAGAGAGNGGGKQNQAPFWAEARPVTVDVTEGTQVILKDGVSVGDSVVVDGQEKLRNGSRVIPTKATRVFAADSIGAQTGTSAPTGNAGQAGQNQQHGQPGNAGGTRP